ncbi:hypothetical protein HPB47_004386 [Ixodes persulcatus]|uniref:Uncharacterized protein n=1 Tax=Ixodes persulcatus TaxID=34615 RepID=A0AC60PFZ1_IXOPE|nr:hypothetical protein HPB47_004386 [Ixodes persulcatus]
MRGNRLPPELQLIAETELGETDERKIEALEEFNQLLDEEPDLYSRRDDEFLLRFLRVAKYNVHAALKRLKEYYKMRKECPFVFENFLPSSAKLEARSMAMVLPRRDVHGRLVLLLRLGAWNPQIISYIEALQAITLVVEHLTADPAAQTTGVSCIHDYGGFSMDKFIAINFGLLKSSIKLLLDCVPTRSKAVHIVKQSYAFDVGFAMVRPFISKKISERRQTWLLRNGGAQLGTRRCQCVCRGYDVTPLECADRRDACGGGGARDGGGSGAPVVRRVTSLLLTYAPTGEARAAVAAAPARQLCAV